MSITEEIVDKAADDMAGLFRSYGNEMDEAYTRIDGNLIVSVKCTWKPSEQSGAIDAALGISFKLDEVNEKFTRTYSKNGDQSDGPIIDYAQEEWRRRREILFRNFRPFAAMLRIRQTVNTLRFRQFAL